MKDGITRLAEVFKVKSKDYEQTKLESLKIPSGTINRLDWYGVKSVKDLLEMSEADFDKYRCGGSRYKEVVKCLEVFFHEVSIPVYHYTNKTNIADSFNVKASDYAGISIKRLDLPLGTSYRLQRSEIYTIDSLLKWTWSDLIHFNNVSKEDVVVLKQSLEDYFTDALKKSLQRKKNKDQKNANGTANASQKEPSQSDIQPDWLAKRLRVKSEDYTNIALKEIKLPLGIESRLSWHDVNTVGNLLNLSKAECEKCGCGNKGRLRIIYECLDRFIKETEEIRMKATLSESDSTLNGEYISGRNESYAHSNRRAKTLAKQFKVDSDMFKSVHLNQINMSQRLLFQFYRHDITTFTELLALTWDDLEKWNGFGRRSQNELTETINQFLKAYEKKCESRQHLLPVQMQENVIEGKKIEIGESPLSLKRVLLIKRYNEAVEAVGSTEVKFFLQNPDYSSFLAEWLRSEANRFDMKQHCLAIISKLPLYARTESAMRVFDTYSSNNSFLQEMLTEEEFELPFELVLYSKIEKWITNDSFIKFEKWLVNDYPGTLTRLVDKNLPERVIDVLFKRAEGMSLGQIGDVAGVTRERIRQLEMKGTNHITWLIDHYKLTSYLYLQFRDRGIVKAEDFDSIFGKYGQLFAYCFRIKQNKYFQYDKECNDFVFFNNM